MEDITLLTPSQDEAELFYSNSSRECECIGHLRGDFGSSGNEFWTTWWPHSAGSENTAEFRDIFYPLVNTLRKNLLRDRKSMFDYMEDHDVRPLPVATQTYGYCAHAARYSFYLRCLPSPGDYNFYIYCYKRHQPKQADGRGEHS